jgi:hypothetical protein
MKTTIFALFLFSGAVLSSRDTKAQSENAILGVWFNTEKTAQVEIFKRGATFFGKIVWLKDPNPGGKPAVDKVNSDPKLKLGL